MGKSWLTTGNAYGLQDGSTYIKQHGTLSPFVWGGRCWRLEDSSETLGGLTITTRFDPRGGIERDSVRAEPPAEASGTLVMKRLQADRAKSDLRRCYWDLDQRMQCGGLDRDAWTKWEEITRYCYAKFNERGLSGTNWEGDEDAMVNLPYVALSVDDIYRVGGSEFTAPASLSVDIVDVDVCQPERCPDRCDDQEDCIVAAVTLRDTTTYLLTNLAGGDDDNWTATNLAAFTTGTNDASKVLCMGSLIIALSTTYKGIILTHIGSLTTQTAIGPTDVTIWNTYAPACIDGIDQSFIVVGCAGGYVTISYDGGVTWETVSSGEATTNAIGDIMIARDNLQVIYASSSAADVVIKSENGGRSWYAVTATGCATGLTALYVVDQATVLVGNSTGQVRQTTDGGITWTEQNNLPGATTKANVTINDITGCGCGVLYMAVTETAVAPRIYRNVDGGASGRWYQPDDIGTLTATTGPAKAIACCGPNHAVAVGGGTTTASSTILIE